MVDLNTRPQAPFLIFDMETVPDIPLIAEAYSKKDEYADCAGKWNDLLLYETLQKEANKSFFSPLYHSVVSICGLYIDPETFQIIDGFRKSVDLQSSYGRHLEAEKKLLQDFWAFSIKYKDIHRTWYDARQSDYRMSDYQRKKLKPLPVVFSGYNIIDFDLPVLEQRSIKNWITCPIAEYGVELGTDSYRYRYAADKVFDLCQYISNFNPSHKTKLNTFARTLGLSGKMEGVDGSQVAEFFFKRNQIKTIEEYCAVDVLITYGVFLAVQKFRGILTDEILKEAKQNFQKFLLQEGKPLPYRQLAETSQVFFQESLEEKI